MVLDFLNTVLVRLKHYEALLKAELHRLELEKAKREQEHITHVDERV